MNTETYAAVAPPLRWEYLLTADIVNLPQILKNLDGDWDLFQDVVALFLTEYPAQLTALRQALAAADAPAVKAMAHALKGSLANVGSQTAYYLANTIELIAREGDINNAALVFEVLKVEMACLQVFFTQTNWRHHYGH